MFIIFSWNAIGSEKSLHKNAAKLSVIKKNKFVIFNLLLWSSKFDGIYSRGALKGIGLRMAI